MRLRGGRRLTGPGGLRTGLTLAAVLMVAAGTQVIPEVSLPPVTPVTLADALPTAPFQARIEANAAQVAAAARSSEPDLARVAQGILEEGRQLLSFAPEANRGRGSWAELVGSIDERTEAVGILVPGSAAFIVDHNFRKYYNRAKDLVEASDGALAMVVWAAGTFPKGWIQGAITSYHDRLGRALATFSHELRAEIVRQRGPAAEVRIVVAGHSFGGAVVGTAERHGLDADAVMHIASAGVGKARDPYDYPEPTRPRYSMTAPGDLIGYVQGLPGPPGMGHGKDPDEFRCVTNLPPGRLPDDPEATDEKGRPLGDRAGDPIRGAPSHSDVFIRYSDAWQEIYSVFAGTATVTDECPPPRDSSDPIRIRVLPLVVPGAATASQCRSGAGLRPAGGRRLAGGG